MTPNVNIYNEDCLVTLRAMPDNSVDSIVTDPPYGLSNIKPERITEAIVAWASGDRERVPDGKGFMGKAWDSFVPPPAVWDECLRVLKPGGHLVAFAGSRTHDLMGLSIRMAGFEIRDGLAWLYGSGFPKSMNVSKAIDKAAGAERGTKEVPFAGSAYSANAGNWRPWMDEASKTGVRVVADDTPVTSEAKQWEGWGTALKPAFEPITLARKPLEGTVAANVLKWGTGALNIDGCRIETTDNLNGGAYAKNGGRSESASLHAGSGMNVAGATAHGEYRQPAGRWPANVALDEHQAAALDEQSGTLVSGKAGKGGHTRNAASGEGIYGNGKGFWQEAGSAGELYGDPGGASRFFYCAKANSKERPEVGGVKHPTVKPLSLMRWLVRLVTPEGGTVFDPFAGSGTTVEAAMLEGFDAVGVELSPEYAALCHQRVDRHQHAGLAPVASTSASPQG